MNTNSFRLRNIVDSIQPQVQPQAQAQLGSKKKNQKVIKVQVPEKKEKGKTRKDKISAALREQVWVQQNGQVFKAKCAVTWCQNHITVFDFQCGHDIPESKGGPTNITNLYPICSRCNMSMSNTYTFKEWCRLYEAKQNAPPVSDPQQVQETASTNFCCGWFS